MFVDYHIHPDYSCDAKDSIDALCRKALSVGLDEICFTTHYDLDPVRNDIDCFVRVNGKLVSSRSNWFDYYFEDLEKAKATYARKGLNVKFGVEVDYQRAVEDEVKRILSERHFDFVLGAVHSVDHVSISLEDEALICFREKSAREVCEKYYLQMESAVKSGLFDVIAHLDIYRKYSADLIDKDTQSVCADRAERVFDLMVEKNVSLEINTSAFRRGEGEPFPSMELLERWKSRNQKMVTVGSDAHVVTDLGADIDKGVEVAKKLGLKICTFKDRKVEKCF